MPIPIVAITPANRALIGAKCRIAPSLRQAALIVLEWDSPDLTENALSRLLFQHF
jgi:hypothetical protein